jgi:diguanylate cyclase (GGDEF)-like protein
LDEVRQLDSEGERLERASLEHLHNFDSKDVVTRSLEAAGFKDVPIDDLDEETQQILAEQRDTIAMRAAGLPDPEELDRRFQEASTIVEEWDALGDADVSDERLEELRREGIKDLPEPMRRFGNFALQRALINGSMLSRALFFIPGSGNLADKLIKESNAVNQSLLDTGTGENALVIDNALGNVTDVLLLGKLGVTKGRDIAAIFGFNAFNRAIADTDATENPTLNKISFAVGQAITEYALTLTFNKVLTKFAPSLGAGVEGLNEPLKAGAKGGMLSVARRLGLASIAEIPEENFIEAVQMGQAILQGFQEVPTAEEAFDTFKKTTLGAMVGGTAARTIQELQQRGVSPEATDEATAVEGPPERRKSPDTITLTREAHASLKEAANKDKLTGIGNTRIEEKAVKTLFKRADREGTPTAVVGFDIGNFKAVNDNLGENVGDQALQLFSDSINEAIRTERADGDKGRPRDVAGVATRRGGDEFRIILPNATAEAGQAVADRVAQAFDAKLKEAGIQLPAEGRPVFAAPGVVQRDAGDTRTQGQMNSEVDAGIKASKARIKTELGVPLTREEGQQPEIAGAKPATGDVSTEQVAPATPVRETQETGSQAQQKQAPQDTDAARLTEQQKLKADLKAKRAVRKAKKGVRKAEPTTEGKAFKEAKASPKPPSTPRQFFGAGFRRATAAGRERLTQLKDEIRSKSAKQEDIRKELATLARKLLPRTESAKLLQAIAKAKTPRQAQAIRGRIGAAVEVVAKRAADVRFKRLRKKTKFRTLAPEVVELLGGKDEVAKLKALDIRSLDASDVEAAADRLIEAQTIQKAVTKMRIGGTVKSLNEWVTDTTANTAKSGKFQATETKTQTGLVSRFIEEEQKKVEELLISMDGGVEDGPNSKVYYQQVVDGVTEQNSIQQEQETEMFRLLGEDALTEVSRWDRTSLEPSTVAKLRGITTAVSVEFDSGRTVKMTRQELAEILAHAEANREKLLKAGFVFERNRALKKVSLTEADLSRLETVAKDTSPLISGMKRSVLIAMNGKLQEQFDGAHTKLRGFSNLVEGTFFPIRRDVTSKVPRLEGLSDYNQFVEATVGNIRETKQRTNSNLPFVIGDIMTTYNGHVRRISGFIGLAERMRNVLFILNNPKSRKTMDRSFGTQRHKALRRIYDAVAQEVVGRRPPEGLVNATAAKLVSNATRGVLAANVFVILKQPVSFLLANTEMSATALAKGASATAKLGPIGTPEANRLDKLMVQWNPNLWHRFRTNRLRLHGLFDPEGGVVGKVKTLSQRLMGGISEGDRAAIRGIFKAGIEEAKAETDFKFGSPEFISVVNRKVDRVIARSQPTVLTMDQAGIALESRTNALVKVSAAMFMSQRNQIYNIARRAIRRGGKRGLREITLALAVSPLLISMVDELRRWAYGYDDDRDVREKVEDAIMAVVEQDLSIMYGSGTVVDLASAIKRQLKGERGRIQRSENILSSTVTETFEGTQDIMEAVTRAGETFKSGDKRGQSVAIERGVRGLTKLTFAVGAGTGSPISSPLRLVRGLHSRFMPKAEYSTMFKERARLRKIVAKEQETGRQLLSDFQHEKLAVIEETLTLANLAFTAADRGEVTQDIANAYAAKRVLEGLETIETLEESVGADTFNKGVEGPDPAEEAARALRKENGKAILALNTRIKDLSFVEAEFKGLKTVKAQRRFLRENPEAKLQLTTLKQLRRAARLVATNSKAASSPRVSPERQAQIKAAIKQILEKAEKL